VFSTAPLTPSTIPPTGPGAEAVPLVPLPEELPPRTPLAAPLTALAAPLTGSPPEVADPTTLFKVLESEFAGPPVGGVEIAGVPPGEEPEPPDPEIPPPEPDGPEADPPFTAVPDSPTPRFEPALPAARSPSPVSEAVLGISRVEPDPASRAKALAEPGLASAGADDACDAEPIELTASITLDRPKPCAEERIVKITNAPIAAALISAAETAAAK
jgi:hypothetical protein